MFRILLLSAFVLLESVCLQAQIHPPSKKTNKLCGVYNHISPERDHTNYIHGISPIYRTLELKEDLRFEIKIANEDTLLFHEEGFWILEKDTVFLIVEYSTHARKRDTYCFDDGTEEVCYEYESYLIKSKQLYVRRDEMYGFKKNNLVLVWQ